MRMFEIPIGACSLWFEPLAEVACPRQSPFTDPSPRLRGLHASFVLPIRPKATCHFPSFPTMMVSTPSTSGVLYNSVTTFTTFPFSVVAYVHFFFSLGRFWFSPASPSPFFYHDVPDTQCDIPPCPLQWHSVFPFPSASLSYAFSLPLHVEGITSWTCKVNAYRGFTVTCWHAVS